jgi:zinc transport system substrate-binding protein
MLRHALIFTSLGMLSASQATADIMGEQPRVVTDILPIAQIAARVMADVELPMVLLPPNADPHHHTLSVSDATALQDAHLVIWVGPELTPWLQEPLDALSQDAHILTLQDTADWGVLQYREPDAHEDHDEHEDDHSEHEDDHDEHDEHDDHGGEHDEHEDEHDDHEGEHDAHGLDPHGWVDPYVARVWAQEIANALSAKDPKNAQTYQANVAELTAELNELTTAISAELAPYAQTPFVLPHDGYQYFENRFGLTTIGFITEGHTHEPTPRHIAELREDIQTLTSVCVFGAAALDPSWIALVSEGSDLRTAQLDPFGAAEIDPENGYIALVSSLADAFVDCLKP